MLWERSLTGDWTCSTRQVQRHPARVGQDEFRWPRREGHGDLGRSRGWKELGRVKGSRIPHASEFRATTHRPSGSVPFSHDATGLSSRHEKSHAGIWDFDTRPSDQPRPERPKASSQRYPSTGDAARPSTAFAESRPWYETLPEQQGSHFTWSEKSKAFRPEAKAPKAPAHGVHSTAPGDRDRLRSGTDGMNRTHVTASNFADSTKSQPSRRPAPRDQPQQPRGRPPCIERGAFDVA
eukprot:g18089.t1